MLLHTYIFIHRRWNGIVKYDIFDKNEEKNKFFTHFRLVPESKFTDVPKLRTRTLRGTLFPLYDEKFDLGKFNNHIGKRFLIRFIRDKVYIIRLV